MNPRRTRFLPYFRLAVLPTILFASVASLAQGSVPGVQPFSTSAGGPYDSVDLGNTGIFLSIPVRSKAGKIPFSYSIVGNSGYSIFTSGSSSGWVSYYSLTGEPMMADFGSTIGGTSSTVTCGSSSDKKWSNIYVIDPTGASHPFSGTYQSGLGGCSVAYTQTTSDGTGYTLVIPASSTSYTNLSSYNYSLYDKAGNKSSQSGSTITVTDPDSVSMNSTLSGGTTTYTDTLGATVLTAAHAGGTSGDTYGYIDGNGTAQTINVSYTWFPNVWTNFRCSGVADSRISGAYLPTTITTPAGNFGITYEQTPGEPSGYVTERIAKITLPTGGYVSYSYTGGSNNTGINCTSGVVPILTRSIYDNVSGTTSTWTYVNTNTSSTPGNFMVIETDPAYPVNNQIVHYFSGEYETERVTYEGGCPTSTSSACNGGGTRLSTTITCYSGNNSTQGGCTSPGSVPTLPITQTDVYSFVYSSSASGADLTETIFDTYGNVTEVKKYDYGATFPPSGTPLADTTISYDTTGSCGTLNSYIYNRPCSATTMDSSGHQISQTRYSYSGNAAGHPTQTQRWVSGSTSLTYNATYNANGTLATTTDANSGVNTYGYASGCNNLLLTSTSYPNGLSTSQTWDCNGGVVTSTTGMDGHSATMAYADPLWRPSTYTDPTSAASNYSYSTSAPMTAEGTLTVGSSSAQDVLMTTDGLGRTLVTQQRQQPGGTSFDSVETDYDLVGRVKRRTMPYAGAAGQTNSAAPAMSYQYDALGRPVSSTDANGGSVTYSYNLNDVLVTRGPAPGTENAKRRQLEYDGLGRLKSVCEITSAANGGASCSQNTSATGFLTTYTYSNNALTVKQNANGSTAQTRTYTYDGLGRLIAEVNPESGTTNYTYDTDSAGTCGTPYYGDLVRKNTNVGTVCYTYDKMHRVLSIAYPSSSTTDSKYFVYDSATVNGTTLSNVAGRLAEAYTCPPTGSCSTKKTDLGLMYTARGEVQTTLESTPNSSGYFRVCGAYWPNGALKSLNCLANLPYIVYGSTNGTNSAGMDGEGRITYVWAQSGNPPVTNVTYNTSSTAEPIGALTQVEYGSNDTDTFTYDTNTGRMTSFTGTAGTQSQSGTLSWNANGSLAHLIIADTINPSNAQTCNFAYDDLARVNLDDCGSTWHQTFSFDPFGNIRKTATAGISFLPTYNQSTNQISALSGCSPSYDANGNMTNDCAHTYASDSEGRVTSIDSTNITYDALGRAVEWSVGGGHRQAVYDPLSRKIAVMNGISALVKSFLPLPGGGEMVDTPGVLPAYYRHADWLGSSRLATTQLQAPYYDGAYAAFGENYAGSGTTDLDFTGQNQDTASGIYDFLMRRYSPVQGRWITPDPAGLDAVDITNPQTWNRYAYVANNPLSYVDPSGLNRQGPGQGGCNTDEYNCFGGSGTGDSGGGGFCDASGNCSGISSPSCDASGNCTSSLVAETGVDSNGFPNDVGPGYVNTANSGQAWIQQNMGSYLSWVNAVQQAGGSTFTPAGGHVPIFLNWSITSGVYGINSANGETIDAAGLSEALGSPASIDGGEYFGIGSLLQRNLSGAGGVPGTCAVKGGITICEFATVSSCTNQPTWTTTGVIDEPPGAAAWWSYYWCVYPGGSWQFCRPVPGSAVKTANAGPAYCKNPGD